MRLVLVLGDQLTEKLSALSKAEKSKDVVIMAEVMEEAMYVPHHPKKIAFTLTAMRKFAARLEGQGWKVAYSRLDNPENSQSIVGELLRRAAEYDAESVIYTEPGEWRLIEALADLPLKTYCLTDDRFICSHDVFAAWAGDRKQLRMEYFYREMRRKTGLLMVGDEPEAGQWNFDHDNRKPAKEELAPKGPLKFTPDVVTQEVLDLVAHKFNGNFGDLTPFWFATDSDQAHAHLDHWIKTGLPNFGDYQDAMLTNQPFMYHAIVGIYLNAGLLDPLDVCQKVEAAWRDGNAPLNAVEGFIRQIIGWREFVRGVYFLEGPEYVTRNALDHDKALPAVYWGGKTRMKCMEQAVAQTKEHAYAHHIQRLMITGNFGMLAGIAPSVLHGWYLAVYADAYEWVEAPNTVGMSQYADGGIIASKPYVSSGNYISRMSDYCQSCTYKVKDKTGPNACPFNLLYWHFLDRHSDRFKKNPRMGQTYATWSRMDPEKRETILTDATDFLTRLDEGAPV